MTARAVVAAGAAAFVTACAISHRLIWVGVAVFVAMALVGVIIAAGERYAADPHATIPTRLHGEDRPRTGAPVAAWSAAGHITDDAADFITWTAEMKGSQS
jgi:hypothetical protein